MNKTVWVFGLAWLLTLSTATQSQQPQAPVPAADYPAWAFPLKVEKRLPPAGPEPKMLAGSSARYTQEQVDDLLNPPDWFPDQRPDPPAIILKGHDDALACGACHLLSGLGHPESADLTGLTVAYIVQQMKDFKAGSRIDVPRMNKIAGAVSEDESQQAAAWFARLKPRPFARVVEADTVPKTFVGDGRMRFVEPDGGTEPIGNRIITVPEDQARARLRDPDSGFLAYVPAGSIAKGKELAGTGGGGRTVPCAICHGADLRGVGNVPRLTGVHPIYLARQLYRFRDGTRNGASAPLMKPAADRLTDEDIVNLSAYLGSLAPQATSASFQAADLTRNLALWPIANRGTVEFLSCERLRGLGYGRIPGGFHCVPAQVSGVPELTGRGLREIKRCGLASPANGGRKSHEELMDRFTDGARLFNGSGLGGGSERTDRKPVDPDQRGA